MQAVRVMIPTGPESPVEPARPIPAGFNYDMWLGPAPWQPYTPKRCHRTFRYISDYAGGTVTDVGAHYFDLALWATRDKVAGPVSVEGEGVFPSDGLFDTAIRVKLEYVYADGFRINCVNADDERAGRIRFEGEEGWIEVSDQSMTAEPASLLERRLSPGDKPLYRSNDHFRNFLDCVRTRAATVATAEAGHRSATLCHLGNIAMLLGRKLDWDPADERFPKDQQANRLLGRSMRSPWSLF